MQCSVDTASIRWDVPVLHKSECFHIHVSYSSMTYQCFCRHVCCSSMTYHCSCWNYMRILLSFSIQVVPTIYTDLRRNKIHSNQVSGVNWIIVQLFYVLWAVIMLLLLVYLHSQFSVTEHFRDGNVRPKPQPGVFFFYDFSPIKVQVWRTDSCTVSKWHVDLCFAISLYTG
jgi:hypothetical protein